jgi:translocation and assembly module TamA
VKIILLFTLFICPSLHSFKKPSHSILQFNNYENDMQFDVIFSKKTPAWLIKLFREKSNIIKAQEDQNERCIKSQAVLLQLIKKDRKLLKQILEQYGYFDHSIETDLQLFEKKKKNRRPRVKFRINLNDRYRIQSILFKKPFPNVLLKKLSKQIDLKRNSYVDMEKILDNQERFVLFFKRNGFPFVEPKEPQGYLYRNLKTCDTIFDFFFGERFFIQKIEIKGLKRLQEKYVLNRVQWKKNQFYDQHKIDNTLKELSESNLFSSLTIKPLVNQGTMLISLKEMKPRLVGGGATYQSNYGPGVSFYWRHYNLFGSAEYLAFQFSSSQLESDTSFYYNIPDFLLPFLEFKNLISLKKENKRSYSGETFLTKHQLFFPISIRNSEIAQLGIGFGIENGHYKQKNNTDPNLTEIKNLTCLFFKANQKIKYKYSLLSPILSLHYDKRDNKLNPNKGFFIKYELLPSLGSLKRFVTTIPNLDDPSTQSKTEEKSLGLSQFKSTASFYIPFLKDPFSSKELILAQVIRFGIISGKFYLIPPNKRYYLGGEGSIRGYGYQLVGILDKKKRPIGGQSFLEYGSELRYRFSKTLGVVGFFDTGVLSIFSRPKSFKDAFSSIGFGFRYYSPFGPIRIDIAFPFRKRHVIECKKHVRTRKTIDSPFQFYLGIGQSF